MGGGYKEFEDSERGSLTVTARVSNGVSRYAMPTIPELVYAALLYRDGESPENPSTEKFVEGVPNGDKWLFSFQRPDDTSGTFTLEVVAFIKTDVTAEDGAKKFSINNAFLSGNKTGLTIEDDSDEIKVSDPIALSSGKPETVNLKIKVPDGCTLEVDDARFTTTQDGDDSNIYTVSASGISAGIYPVTFTVKKGDEIIHVFSENINILKGLCTDTWWNGSVSCDVKDVAQSISKTLYVRGVGGWYDNTSPYNDGATATASDDNLGSFSSPFATIQKAVDMIIARNDGASNYTICVDGTLECDENTYIGETGIVDFSALTKNLNLTIKALSGTATLDGGARFGEDDADNEGCKKRIIHANPGTNGILNLTIEKLVIKGGYVSNQNGGAIYIKSKATVTMTDVEIKGNKAPYGGGIYVNTGMLEMKNCKIEGNIATGSSGGGIYIVNGGKVTMDGGTISGNEIRGSSNGNYGGGVYISNNSKFTMKGGTISGNILTDVTSGEFGGGVYVSTGTFEMEGGTISGSSARRGGGVYVSNGSTFTMSGGELTDNTAGLYGGGVYIYTNGTFTMQGGTISDCTAGSGGGIYNAGMLTVDSGTKISGCEGNAWGGGIYNTGTATISGCTIELCKVTSGANNAGGGGICNSDGTLTVTGGTIYKCTAEQSNGGGILLTSGSASGSAHGTITDVTISECTAKFGGGIQNYNGRSTFTITGGTISKCIATYSGGGIYNNADDTSNVSTVTNCEISGCKASGTDNTSGGGGIYNASGALELTDVNITGGNDTDNQDARGGGGIYNKGSLTVTGGTISKCTSSSSGGGIYNSSGTLKITGGTISNCIAGSNGGGISTSGTTTTAEIKNCNIESCTANSTYAGNAGGGGIYCYHQELTLTGGTISYCNSANQGGGISIQARDLPLTINGVTITNCNAQNGGGCHIFAIDNQEIKNCIIKSCEATTAGGGICLSTESYGGKYTAITVSNTEISECVSPSGSGVFLPAAASTSICLKDSTVKNDVVTKTGVASIYLAGSTAITEGVIDFSACTSTYKSKVYVQDALMQNSVAKIKLGTVYQSGDTILQAAGDYTLTEADCKRFTIDGDTYDIALSDGEGVLQLKSN